MRRWALVWAIVIVLGMSTALTIQSEVEAVRKQVSLLLSEEKPMKFTWKTAGDTPGTEIEVVLEVPRDPSWTIEQWRAEARSQLTAMQAEFPPVGP